MTAIEGGHRLRLEFAVAHMWATVQLLPPANDEQHEELLQKKERAVQLYRLIVSPCEGQA